MKPKRFRDLRLMPASTFKKFHGVSKAEFQAKNVKEDVSDACPVCGQTPCNCTSINEISPELQHRYFKARYDQQPDRNKRPKKVRQGMDKVVNRALRRNTLNTPGAAQDFKSQEAKRGVGHVRDHVETQGEVLESKEANYGADYQQSVSNLKAKAEKKPVDMKSLAARMQASYKKDEKKNMKESNDICPECLQDPCVCGGNHIVESRMGDKAAGDLDFHPKITKSDEPPFDPPYKRSKGTITDKSGAKHSPMSRVRDLARTAAKKASKPAKLKESESRKAAIVKDAAKGKKKTSSEDTFQPEPQLSSTITKNY